MHVCSSFKLFLELEPQLRDVLYKFHESQYAACLKLLDEMKVCHLDLWWPPVHRSWAGVSNQTIHRAVSVCNNFSFLKLLPTVKSKCEYMTLIFSFVQDNFMLDMYLSPHVNTLYSKIRNRALVQVSDIKPSMDSALTCVDSLIFLYSVPFKFTGRSQ